VRGISSDEPGLSFMGLVFQFAAASDVLPGVGRDAEYVARHVVARARDGAVASRVTAGRG
jgi:putative flavoprotein involved in K+ transport